MTASSITIATTASAPSTTKSSNMVKAECSFDITEPDNSSSNHAIAATAAAFGHGAGGGKGVTTPKNRRGSLTADRRASLLAGAAAALGGTTNELEDSIKFHARDFLSQKQHELLTDYELDGSPLGEGGFGLVYACTHKDTGAERAVKMIQKDPKRPDYNLNIVKEYNILKELDHPVRSSICGIICLLNLLCVRS